MQSVPNSAGTSSPKAVAPGGACDSHIHIYDPRFEMPLPQRRPVANATVADYRLLQRRIGTSRAIVVQPAAFGTDNRVTVDAVQALGMDRARGVGVLHPDVTDAELHCLHAGGIRGLRFTLHDPRTAVTSPEMIEPLGRRIHELGWHVQLHLLADQLVDLGAIVDRLPGTVVIDHMARLPQPLGLAHPAFARLRGWLDNGRTWVKLSGAYLDTRTGPPRYEDVGAVARELARIAPQRLVWGSDWPHPTEAGSKPDDAALFDLVREWTGSGALFERVLVDNPAKLYGFD
ncbi:MAG TPA: amidohydrolase family protein [Usitatibacter sp.]|nr:amidohydrolase family protein [Usitatibacter sp.]